MIVLFLLLMGLNAVNFDTSESLLEGAVNRYIYLKNSTDSEARYGINETIVEFKGLKGSTEESDGLFKYCATFKRGDVDYDVDYYIAEKNGTYNVVKEVLHKRNGESVEYSLWELETPAQKLGLPMKARLETNERVVVVSRAQ